MDASGRIRFVSRQVELPVCKIYQEYWQDSCPGPQARARGLDLVRSGRWRDGHWFRRASRCPTLTPGTVCRWSRRSAIWRAGMRRAG